MALSTEHTQLIINTDAKRAKNRLESIKKIVSKQGFEAIYCQGPELDNTIRKALKNKKLHRLIIGGGDGSVSLAASLIEKHKPKIELAVFPLGTANYYAKSLGMPLHNLKKALSATTGVKIEKRHICKANSRTFLIGVNIGVTSRMFSEVRDNEKQRFGKLAYVAGVVRILIKTRPKQVHIDVKGKKFDYKTTEVVVLNQHIVEPIKMVPDVKGSDPYFEIITYGFGNSKLSPLFAVAVFVITLGRNQKYLKRIKATKVTIRTNKPQPVAIDGDSLEETPVKIELLKKPIAFVCNI